MAIFFTYDRIFGLSARALALVNIITLVQGYCGTIEVSKAQYQTAINGKYYIIGSYLCNFNNLWQQNDNKQYYISYISTTYGIVNGTAVSGWVIGRFPRGAPCFSFVAEVLVINPRPSSSEPYNLRNTWYELNGTTYALNPNLKVNCTNALSGLAVFGLVIASILTVLLLLCLLICCFSKHTKHHRRTDVEPVAVYYTSTHHTVIGPYPSGGYAPPPTLQATPTVVQPPAYDDSAPPAYDTISTPPGKASDLQGGVGASGESEISHSGTRNDGLRA